MDIRQQVGTQIKVLRQNRSLSQDELASLIDRSTHAISAIERGKSLPNFATLDALSKALDVPVKEFFDLDDGEVSVKRVALIADIRDMLHGMSDEELETCQKIVRTIAGQ